MTAPHRQPRHSMLLAERGPSIHDVRALLSILPSSGDTAHGLNWTILHAIEAAPSWPLWAALTDTDNEWTATFLVRLKNGGYIQPQP